MHSAPIARNACCRRREPARGAASVDRSPSWRGHSRPSTTRRRRAIAQLCDRPAATAVEAQVSADHCRRGDTSRRSISKLSVVVTTPANARPSVDTMQLCIPPATIFARDVTTAEPVPGDAPARGIVLGANQQRLPRAVAEPACAAGFGSGEVSAFRRASPYASLRAGADGGAIAFTVLIPVSLPRPRRPCPDFTA
jgi:hypothetical protein